MIEYYVYNRSDYVEFWDEFGRERGGGC